MCIFVSPTAPSLSDAAGTLPEATLETLGLVACRLSPLTLEQRTCTQHHAFQCCAALRRNVELAVGCLCASPSPFLLGVLRGRELTAS